MDNGKTVGLDNIAIEVWKCLREKGISWLKKLFNKIMWSKKISDYWRRSTLVPIYKNKGDIQNYANYKGIKLVSHIIKLWERVIEMEIEIGDSYHRKLVYLKGLP